MAKLNAAFLLLFAFFTASLAQIATITSISTGEYNADDVYQAAAANGVLRRFFIVDFDFTGVDNTVAAKLAAAKKYENLFATVIADSIYSSVTGIAGAVITSKQAADNFVITGATAASGNRYTFDLTMPTTAGAVDNALPARISFPIQATDTAAGRRWHEEFFTGLRRSPSVLLEKNNYAPPASIWRTSNNIIAMNTARFVEPLISLETNDWVGLKSATLITNGGSGPNGEANYFKVAFATNTLLVPGQRLLCQAKPTAAGAQTNKACSLIFGFLKLFTNNVITAATNTDVVLVWPKFDANGKANGNTAAVADFMSEINTLPTGGDVNFRRLVLTTGTTFLPGDTIFAEFRVNNPVKIDGVFGVETDIDATFDPIIRRMVADDGSLGNIITRVHALQGGNTHVPGTYITKNDFSIRSVTAANRIDQYEPHTVAVSIRTAKPQITTGNQLATGKVGFTIDDETKVETSPRKTMGFYIGTVSNGVANTVLTGITAADFQVQIFENGGFGTVPYNGEISISSDPTRLIPFISGSACWLFFNPPLEARDGKVFFSLLSDKTATDVSGVISGVPGNKITAVPRQAGGKDAPNYLTMRVSCTSTYGLIRCGALCRHFTTDDNCGGCGSSCNPETTGKFCMMNPSVLDTVPNRHLSSSYACNSPALYSAVPIPVNRLASPIRPSFPEQQFKCDNDGSASTWCFYWKSIKSIYDALPTLKQGEEIDLRIHTKFRFRDRTNPPADSTFTVQIHTDMRNLAQAGALPLVPTNPLFLASVTRVTGLTDTKPEGYEWYSIGRREGDLVVVAMKFSSQEAARNVGPRINPDDFLKVQAKVVRSSLLPSLPVGGFSDKNPQQWSNADFNPPNILQYDEELPFDARTNSGLQFRATAGGVYLRWATATDLDTPNYRVYIRVLPSDTTFNPTSVKALLDDVRPRIVRDWQNVHAADRCCDGPEGYAGAFNFVAGNVGRIDIAGLAPNKMYKAWLVMEDTNNEPNYSPIITRVFTTQAVLAGADARNTINLDFRKTVSVTV